MSKMIKLASFSDDIIGDVSMTLRGSGAVICGEYSAYKDLESSIVKAGFEFEQRIIEFYNGNKVYVYPEPILEKIMSMPRVQSVYLPVINSENMKRILDHILIHKLR